MSVSPRLNRVVPPSSSLLDPYVYQGKLRLIPYFFEVKVFSYNVKGKQAVKDLMHIWVFPDVLNQLDFDQNTSLCCQLSYSDIFAMNIFHYDLINCFERLRSWP